MRKFLFIIMFVVAALVAAPRQATACSCTPRISPEAEFSQTEAVFVGTVTAVQGSYLATMTVVGYWKGQLNQIVTVAAYYVGCEITFRVGQTYLIYASKDSRTGFFTTTTCSRTRTGTLASAETDLGPAKRL